MNWDAVGAIAELAGAVGIVVTLLYLSVQIRQNSALLSASLANAGREAANDLTTLLASDRDAVRVFWAGLEDRDSLDPLDRQQFDALITLWFAQINQGFQTSDEVILQRFSDWGLDRKGIRQWWILYATTHSPAFRVYIDERLDVDSEPRQSQ